MFRWPQMQTQTNAGGIIFAGRSPYFLFVKPSKRALQLILLMQSSPPTVPPETPFTTLILLPYYLLFIPPSPVIYNCTNNQNAESIKTHVSFFKSKNQSERPSSSAIRWSADCVEWMGRQQGASQGRNGC